MLTNEKHCTSILEIGDLEQRACSYQRLSLQVIARNQHILCFLSFVPSGKSGAHFLMHQALTHQSRASVRPTTLRHKLQPAEFQHLIFGG